MNKKHYYYRNKMQQPSLIPNSNEEDEKSSSYVDHSKNDLTVISGAALLIADCMGTGILALPHDMIILGKAFGLSFLILNLPINFYAGVILAKAAKVVEERHRIMSHDNASTSISVEDEKSSTDSSNDKNIQLHHERNTSRTRLNPFQIGHDYDGLDSCEKSSLPITHPLTHHDVSTAHTFDFIGITSALFDESNKTTTNSSLKSSSSNNHSNLVDENNTSSGCTISATILVTCIYYTNIFLVLGNYILVMSHAVSAMIGEENICLPIAGIIASTLMFGLSQLRTMSNLGRSASVISLLSLFVVVAQCLTSLSEKYQNDEKQNYYSNNNNSNNNGENESITIWSSLIRQFAAISSIGFAVGSQKLFLNIRHEFADRANAPISLGIALTCFGSIYVLVCILAGPDPPSFLFDAIASGSNRKIAGFLLWVHVAVSFAINSQALCSSIDRVRFHRVSLFNLHNQHKLRWAVLTFLVAISSYLIANAVPFFKDLVALIGALTSVPLTLLLPALYHRKIMNVPLFLLGSWNDIGSYLLVVFSLVFLICGVTGSLRSIQLDWQHHGAPFACY